jgi:hypothetical protein
MSRPVLARAARTLALMLGVWACAPAQAGRPCEARPPEASQVQQALELAERTARWLDASGARVVAIAREGQDLSRWGLQWSHLGWAYREEPEAPAAAGARARWRVVHKLNQCGSASAALYRQGLAEFFLDDLHRLHAGVMLPRPDLQARLLPLLQDNRRVAQLHQPAYSMVAYPWAQRYQQSNQWALELLAQAMEPEAVTRDRAQAWLRFKGYEPSVLRIDALTRLGARVGSAHIAFDDHPDSKRYADRIETVSVDSVFAWLGRSGLAGPLQVVR